MRHFDMEMNELKSRLVNMTGLVEQMIRSSIEQLVKRDPKVVDTIKGLEKEVNIEDIVLDDKCLKLIALNQPVGADLRFLTAAMRITSDLERMGDEAVNISEMAMDLLEYPQLKPLIDIPKMASLVENMVTSCIKAFNESDAELAREVLAKDDEVDALKDKVIEDLKEYMIKSSEPSTIQCAVDLMFVAKSIERIGDHATNICEDIIFMIHGKDIRHPRLFSGK